MELKSILAISPYFEVIARHLYWNFSFLTLYKDKILKKKKKPVAVIASFPSIIEKLREWGVGEGDLLVIHSSLSALRPTGMGKIAIIESLIELVGKSGTIAMPAFPRFKNELKGRDRLTKDISDMVFEYNLIKTPAWTGALPNSLLKFPDAIRSKHPLNSMVAVGPLAKPMMKNNLAGDKPLPCGENSSWKFCADNHAKILGLGIDLTHSLTLIHVAEDVNVDSWPVKNWYRDRLCIVIDGNEQQEIVVRERHPKWALHFAERTLRKDLLKEKILIRDYVDGILLEMLDGYELIKYLNSRNETGYPYYMIKG